MIERHTPSWDIDVPGLTPTTILGFIRDCVLWKKPEHSLEVGSFMGRSAATICEALAEIGGRRTLTCVDFFVQEYGPRYLDRPVMRNAIRRAGPPETQEMYKDFTKLKRLEDCFHLTVSRKPAMQERVTLVVSSTENMDLSCVPLLDFAFLDADKDYAGIQETVIKVLSRLQPEGLIVFDDYIEPFPEIMRFVDEFREKDVSFVGCQDNNLAFAIPRPTGLAEALKAEQLRGRRAQ